MVGCYDFDTFVCLIDELEGVDVGMTEEMFETEGDKKETKQQPEQLRVYLHLQLDLESRRKPHMTFSMVESALRAYRLVAHELQIEHAMRRVDDGSSTEGLGMGYGVAAGHASAARVAARRRAGGRETCGQRLRVWELAHVWRRCALIGRAC